MSKSGRGEKCMRGIIPAGFISSNELKLEYVNIPKAQRTTCRLKNFGNEIAQWIMNKFIASPCKRSNIFNKSVKKLKLNKKGSSLHKIGIKVITSNTNFLEYFLYSLKRCLVYYIDFSSQDYFHLF